METVVVSIVKQGPTENEINLILCRLHLIRYLQMITEDGPYL